MMTPQTTTATSLPHYVVSTIAQDPFVMRSQEGGKEVWSGYVKDLLDELAKEVKFTYNFMQASDDTYGRHDPDGWKGIIGDVQNGVAQIGAGALTNTIQREQVVDFTSDFMKTSVALLVKKPKFEHFGLGYLVRPFSPDYWIMVLVLILLIGILFFLIGKFSPYEWGNVAAEKDPRGARNSFSLRNSYLFVLSAITWQGFREAPRSISGRILAAFWWIWVLFTLIAYTANLSAYFITRPEQMPVMPFTTYDDLVASSDLRVGAFRGGAIEADLRKSSDSTLNRLHRKISMLNDFTDSIEEGVLRVQNEENYAFFMDEPSAEYRASQDCNVMVYGRSILAAGFAFAVAEKSSLRRELNNGLAKLKLNGKLEELREKWWQYRSVCSNIDGRKFTAKGDVLSSLPIYAITLKDMAVAILLLFLGAIVAVVFLVIEIVHYQVTKKGKKLPIPQKPHLPKKLNEKIFKSKSSKPPKPADDGGEAGTSGDGLESVPLSEPEEPAASSDELQVEDSGKAQV